MRKTQFYVSPNDKFNISRNTEALKKKTTPPGFCKRNSTSNRWSGECSTQKHSSGSSSSAKNLASDFDWAKADKIIKQNERLKADITRPPGNGVDNILARFSHHAYSGYDDAFFSQLPTLTRPLGTKLRKGRQFIYQKYCLETSTRMMSIRWRF